MVKCHLRLFCLLPTLLAAAVCSAQAPPRPSAWPPETFSDAAYLPGDQIPLDALRDELPAAVFEPPPQRLDYSELMRPTFSFSAEWQGEAGDIELASYDARVMIPTYPIFGPPPPFLSGGFSWTDLNAPDSLGLPTDLYDYSLGLSWMRPLNDRWMVRFMFSTALATDGKNTGGDAWQFRGGFFATYRPNERWTWIVGALALGRSDIPAVPAVGAIWQPHPGLRFDLTMPRPRIAKLLVDNGPRQQWAYIGGGLNGGTWAFQRADQSNDRLTYGDWRVVVGWESVPAAAAGMPFTRGRKFGLEAGYSFAREFEFDGGSPDINLDDTWLLRATASF